MSVCSVEYAVPGEKGESQSRSMSMGEPEEVAETSSWELPLGLGERG